MGLPRILCIVGSVSLLAVGVALVAFMPSMAPVLPLKPVAGLPGLGVSGKWSGVAPVPAMAVTAVPPVDAGSPKKKAKKPEMAALSNELDKMTMEMLLELDGSVRPPGTAVPEIPKPVTGASKKVKKPEMAALSNELDEMTMEMIRALDGSVPSVDAGRSGSDASQPH